MAPKLKILFLCTENSCRSQMAEGWTRALKEDLIEAYSAGIEIHGLNPVAVEVMAEAGVDISKHTSKHIDTQRDRALDAVITVCDNARESCPIFPGKKKNTACWLHRSSGDGEKAGGKRCRRRGTAQQLSPGA